VQDRYELTWRKFLVLFAIALLGYPVALKLVGERHWLVAAFVSSMAVAAVDRVRHWIVKRFRERKP
jgi:maltodextrin utilization protein YvdJ